MFSSLSKKIAILVIIVFFAVGSAFIIIAHQTGYTMLRKQAQSKAHGVAEFGKSILESVMLSGKKEDLKEALKRAIEYGEASDIYILKENGEVILKGNRVYGIEKLPLEKFIPNQNYPNEKFLSLEENDSLYEFIITPIIDKSECRTCHANNGRIHGYMAVKISMNNIRAASLEHRTINIIMTFLTLGVLGGALYIALMFLIIRPVKKLNNQMVDVEQQIKRYEEGENVQFNELDNPESRDEIANLIRTFNALVRRLNDAHTKLYEMHQLELEHADRLATAGEMAASLAHEIRNPIMGVLGALQIFQNDKLNENEYKEIISEMISQLERVNNTVNDLLYYARPSPPRLEKVSINDIIIKTTQLLSHLLKQKQIKIEIKLPPEKVVVNVDKKQIQQVLWNIMLNAIQAIDSIGTLTVLLEQDNSNIKILIKDTGKGIPDEQLQQIFKPFFTTKHKGTGLGMTISKRIIEQHRGKIYINSVVGEGTEVKILIPML